jgi:phosphoesterase RecJ-like protein
LFCSEEQREAEWFGAENRDTDTLYQLLLSVEGAEAVLFIRQADRTHCAVGLRSRDAVDVARVAAVMGGGGHRNAAGAYTEGRIADLKQTALAEFERLFAAG